MEPFIVYSNPNRTINETHCYLDGRYYHGIGFHSHNDCEILYVASGEMVNTLPNYSQTIRSHQLLFTRASDVHSCYVSNVENLAMYTINVPAHLFQSISELYGQDGSYLIDAEHPTCVTLNTIEHNQLMSNLVKASENNLGHEHGQLILNILINSFFYLYNRIDDSKNHPIPPWFNILLTELNKPQNFTASLSKIKQMTNYSDEYLSRCFKKYLSSTPTEYINNLRLDFAAKLLIENNVKIIDVGFASGFSNEAYFYKLFKNRFACTPKEYRQNIISNNP